MDKEAMMFRFRRCFVMRNYVVALMFAIYMVFTSVRLFMCNTGFNNVIDHFFTYLFSLAVTSFLVYRCLKGLNISVFGPDGVTEARHALAESLFYAVCIFDVLMIVSQITANLRFNTPFGGLLDLGVFLFLLLIIAAPIWCLRQMVWISLTIWGIVLAFIFNFYIFNRVADDSKRWGFLDTLLTFAAWSMGNEALGGLIGAAASRISTGKTGEKMLDLTDIDRNIVSKILETWRINERAYFIYSVIGMSFAFGFAAQTAALTW